MNIWSGLIIIFILIILLVASRWLDHNLMGKQKGLIWVFYL